MTIDKDLKRLIRERMAAKGESYRAARAHVEGTLGRSPPIYPWKPEDGYNDNYWLCRAEKDGHATKDQILVTWPSRLRSGTAFSIESGPDAGSSVLVTKLLFDRQGDTEVPMLFRGEYALALKAAANRFLATSTARSVVANELVPNFPKAAMLGKSLPEIAASVGPEFAFIHEPGTAYAMCFGKARTMPAPNPSAGLSTFHTHEDGRHYWSSTHLFGFPGGIFRAAINKFVHGDSQGSMSSGGMARRRRVVG